MQTPTALTLVAGILLGCSYGQAAEAREPVRAEINGLSVAIDADSGGLIEMAYNGVKLLETSPENASLVDAACPGQGFDPFRLGVPYSSGAQVKISPEGVVISWTTLGTSRPVSLGGPVSAEVRIRPAGDGRSLVMSATIDNQSEASIACNSAPWLDSPSRRYAVTPYNETGQAATSRTEAAPAWTERTPTLQPNELALYEIRPLGRQPVFEAVLNGIDAQVRVGNIGRKQLK